MDSPEDSRLWRRANESVWVQPEPGPAQMRLIAVCAVAGTIASQLADLPLQFDVAGASLETELRWELLSAFARSVVEEMGYAKPPVIPTTLPAVA
ncbi:MULTISPECIES: hypothetical protein [Streptomyces]|uniref:hypothetical protein n=1 Tax=Streptomyces TaxID=1883 RepID=UPI00117DF008|nr:MULTISPECIES: hypothetical protein [unclassified Streptomyces]